MDEIETLIRGVPYGRLLTMKHIADHLARKHDAGICCPMATGIFAWIIAHAAHDQGGSLDDVTPWWRVLKTGGKLNPKYPGEGAIQRDRLVAEGHRVTAKGKHLVVENYEAALAAVGAGACTPLGATLTRKVLKRGDLGLCVLLPKTEWRRYPCCGAAQVQVNGAACTVTVQVEDCDCRGEGVHQHRFLSLPGTLGLEPGGRVAIVSLAVS